MSEGNSQLLAKDRFSFRIFVTTIICSKKQEIEDTEWKRGEADRLEEHRITFQFERAAFIGKSDHDVLFSGKENFNVMTKYFVFNLYEDGEEEMLLE